MPKPDTGEPPQIPIDIFGWTRTITQLGAFGLVCWMFYQSQEHMFVQMADDRRMFRESIATLTGEFSRASHKFDQDQATLISNHAKVIENQMRIIELVNRTDATNRENVQVLSKLMDEIKRIRNEKEKP